MEKFEALIQSKTPVLIDFFAEWCGPCQAMMPILDEVKTSVGEKARIVKIDVDKFQELAMEHRIQMVPTFMLYKEGKLLWRHSNVISSKDLLAVIEQNY